MYYVVHCQSRHNLSHSFNCSFFIFLISRDEYLNILFGRTIKQQELAYATEWQSFHKFSNFDRLFLGLWILIAPSYNFTNSIPFSQNVQRSIKKAAKEKELLNTFCIQNHI